MMSRGYGAMLFKKSAAGLDHLKRNVSKFLKQPFVILLETLPQVQVPAGKPSLTGARRTGARDRGHGVAKQIDLGPRAGMPRRARGMSPVPSVERRSSQRHAPSAGAAVVKVCACTHAVVKVCACTHARR